MDTLTETRQDASKTLAAAANYRARNRSATRSNCRTIGPATRAPATPPAAAPVTARCVGRADGHCYGEHYRKHGENNGNTERPKLHEHSPRGKVCRHFLKVCESLTGSWPEPSEASKQNSSKKNQKPTNGVSKLCELTYGIVTWA
jgi:hypothetical protein